jgi:hypothetical protein
MTWYIKEAFYYVLALYIYLNLYFYTSLPDWVLAGLIKFVTRVAEPFDPPPEMHLSMKDLETIFRSGPPGSDAIKNIIHKARFTQAMAVIRGVLVHHAFNKQPY